MRDQSDVLYLEFTFSSPISAEFVAHGSNVNCLSLSPNNGHMLATGGDDRKINLWLIGKPNNIMVGLLKLSCDVNIHSYPILEHFGYDISSSECRLQQQ